MPLPQEMTRVSGVLEQLVAELREMRLDMREIRSDVAATQRQVAQVGWALAVGLLGAVAALLVTHL